MKWSRYSKLFESKRNGWLLFSSASRSFLKIKPEQVPVIEGIMADPEGYDYSQSPMLYMQLRTMGFLVEDGADEDLYNILKMRYLSFLYGDRSLCITFAITTSCNFDCSYCFEANHKGHGMSQEVEDKVIRFIKKFDSSMLHITWYGGEPLLALDRILSINRRLGDIGKPYDAAMITNGYLLTPDKVKHLNDLKINYLQITLDGKPETHNVRRPLQGGGPTYDRILENIDGVMRSDFKGTIHVRVNVDGRNDEEFVYVYRMIQNKYPKVFGRKIMVYPGFVKGDTHPDRGCFFDSLEQGGFVGRMMENYGIAPLNLFPRQNAPGCVLTRRNAFVIGPDGEFYKCWDDVGIPERVVGHVDRFNDWNMGLIAQGMVATSYLDDPECKECYYFPLCNGGCHRIRQNNLTAPVKQSSCFYFKGNLENLLELYYENKLRMQEKAAQAKAQQAKNAQTPTDTPALEV